MGAIRVEYHGAAGNEEWGRRGGGKATRFNHNQVVVAGRDAPYAREQVEQKRGRRASRLASAPEQSARLHARCLLFSARQTLSSAGTKWQTGGVKAVYGRRAAMGIVGSDAALSTVGHAAYHTVITAQTTRPLADRHESHYNIVISV